MMVVNEVYNDHAAKAALVNTECEKTGRSALHSELKID